MVFGVTFSSLFRGLAATHFPLTNFTTMGAETTIQESEQNILELDYIKIQFIHVSFTTMGAKTTIQESEQNILELD